MNVGWRINVILLLLLHIQMHACRSYQHAHARAPALAPPSWTLPRDTQVFASLLQQEPELENKVFIVKPEVGSKAQVRWGGGAAVLNGAMLERACGCGVVLLACVSDSRP